MIHQSGPSCIISQKTGRMMTKRIILRTFGTVQNRPRSDHDLLGDGVIEYNGWDKVKLVRTRRTRVHY